MMMPERNSFVARGGAWVLAQVFVMLLAFLIPVAFGRGRLIPDQTLSFLGVALTALGIMLAVWGLASLGDALTPFPKPLYEASLHRQGAYKLMRHPIYAGLIVASFGWACWWLSLIGVFYGLMLAIFFDRKAAYEEIWLGHKYTKYAEYMRVTKKFIPGLY